MYAGVALTVVAIIVPYIDHAAANVLADHIRAGYPAYTQARIDTAVTTYLVYLSIIGALGVICWLWTIRAVNAGKRWARGTATAMFVLGTGTALFGLLVKDTSGDTGLPPLAGLDRHAAMPGRVPSSHAAMDEIVIGTGQQSGALASDDRAAVVGCPVRANPAGP